MPQWISTLAGEDSATESDEYLDTLKSDFFTHRIFVFTPKGDAIDMPIEATPIDFAYAVHSEIGDHIASVRINGKMAAMGTMLRNGDVVEVMTKRSAKPSQKWLDIAKTSMARRFIRAALEDQRTKS